MRIRKERLKEFVDKPNFRVRATGNRDEFVVLEKFTESVTIYGVKSKSLTETVGCKPAELIYEAREGKPLRELNVGGRMRKILASYRVPISKYTENLNGREYTRPLWERVKKLGMGENRYGLMGHPPDDSDGNPRDTFCVWTNLELTEDIVYMTMHLFGDNGRQVKEAIDAGGDIGLSSVGFGEIGENGRTVIVESFELDRPADYVLNPSQETFGSSYDEVTNTSKVAESTKVKKSANEQISNKKYTNKGTGDIEMKITKAKYKSEKREQIAKICESLDKKKALVDLKRLKEEIEDAFDAEDEADGIALSSEVAEAIESTIEEMATTIDAIAKELGVKTDEAKSEKEKNEDLEEKVKTFTESLDTLKQKFANAVEMLAVVQQENIGLKENNAPAGLVIQIDSINMGNSGETDSSVTPLPQSIGDGGNVQLSVSDDGIDIDKEETDEEETFSESEKKIFTLLKKQLKEEGEEAGLPPPSDTEDAGDMNAEAVEATPDETDATIDDLKDRVQININFSPKKEAQIYKKFLTSIKEGKIVKGKVSVKDLASKYKSFRNATVLAKGKKTVASKVTEKKVVVKPISQQEFLKRYNLAEAIFTEGNAVTAGADAMRIFKKYLSSIKNGSIKLKPTSASDLETSFKKDYLPDYNAMLTASGIDIDEVKAKTIVKNLFQKAWSVVLGKMGVADLSLVPVKESFASRLNGGTKPIKTVVNVRSLNERISRPSTSGVSSDIRLAYSRAVRTNPSIAEYKERILRSKNLSEAQFMIQKYSKSNVIAKRPVTESRTQKVSNFEIKDTNIVKDKYLALANSVSMR